MDFPSQSASVSSNPITYKYVREITNADIDSLVEPQKLFNSAFKFFRDQLKINDKIEIENNNIFNDMFSFFKVGREDERFFLPKSFLTRFVRVGDNSGRSERSSSGGKRKTKQIRNRNRNTNRRKITMRRKRRKESN